MFFCQQQLSAIGQQLKEIFLLIAGTLLEIAVQQKETLAVQTKTYFYFILLFNPCRAGHDVL